MRYNSHRSRLDYGNHCNKKLQAAYVEHGGGNFAFQLLEDFDISCGCERKGGCDCFAVELAKREFYWIENLNAAFNKGVIRPYVKRKRIAEFDRQQASG
jgi:hypothetical protein